MTLDQQPNYSPEKARFVRSFITEKGSVYTYDQNGQTTRFKTATGESNSKQDLTIFVQLTPEQNQLVLESYQGHTKDKKVYVCEKRGHEFKIVRNLEQITDRNNVGLLVLRRSDQKVLLAKKGTLTPTLGFDVFDTRQFQEDGLTYTERHLGHKVVKINY